MQNHVQQGTMDLNSAVVINQAQSSEFVHKKVDTCSRGTNQVRQCLLANFRQHRFWLTFSAEIRKNQQRPLT
jgi:hypothetical protein